MHSASVLALGLYALGAQAVSFSSWRGLACRGEDLVINQNMYPYTCYSAGSDASSIEAKGLANKNNANSYIEVYTDTACKNYASTVKYSNVCIETNFQSARLFVPAVSKKDENELLARNETTQAEDEVDIWQLPFETLTPEQRQIVDEKLEADLLALEQQEISRNDAPQKLRRGMGMSLLPIRAAGDQHTSESDSSVTGIEVEDNNSPGDTAGFNFANAQQRNDWASMTMMRVMNRRRTNGDMEYYEGSQTVNNHDLNFDLEIRDGTLASTPLSLFRSWIAMFARQRDGHSHQIWNLYQNGLVRARLTLTAYRIS